MTIQQAMEFEIAYIEEPDIPAGMTVREYCRSRDVASGRQRQRGRYRRALARLVSGGAERG